MSNNTTSSKDKNEISFLVVSDIHVALEKLHNIADFLVETELNHSIDFILCPGDIANLPTKNAGEIAAESAAEGDMSSVLYALENIHPYIYYVPGNHDATSCFEEVNPPRLTPHAVNIHRRVLEIEDDLLLVGVGGSVPAYSVQNIGTNQVDESVRIWKGYPYHDEDAMREEVSVVESALMSRLTEEKNLDQDKDENEDENIMNDNGNNNNNNDNNNNENDSIEKEENNNGNPDENNNNDNNDNNDNNNLNNNQYKNEDNMASILLMTHCGPVTSSTTFAWKENNFDNLIYSGSKELDGLLRTELMQDNCLLNIHGHTHIGRGQIPFGKINVLNPGAVMEGNFSLVTLRKSNGKWQIFDSRLLHIY